MVQNFVATAIWQHGICVLMLHKRIICVLMLHKRIICVLMLHKRIIFPPKLLYLPTLVMTSARSSVASTQLSQVHGVTNSRNNLHVNFKFQNILSKNSNVTQVEPNICTQLIPASLQMNKNNFLMTGRQKEDRDMYYRNVLGSNLSRQIYCA
jgi:hypothetical protein